MTNRYQQNAARELAERHDTGYSAQARAIREENIRRTKVAQARDEVGEARSVSFMRSIMSTPYAEVRS